MANAPFYFGSMAPMGLSLPVGEVPPAAFPPQRTRSMAPDASAIFGSLAGSGVPTYPEGSREARFRVRPDAPAYELDTVAPVSMLRPEAMAPAPTRLRRDYKPAATDRFMKQKAKTVAENIEPASVLSPGADEGAPGFERSLSMSQHAGAMAKALASGFGTGVADLLALPRAAAEAPSRLMGREVIPDRLVDKLPDSARFRAAAEALTGPWYEPDTEPAKYLHTGAQFLPLAAGGVVGGAVRGGMTGGARGALSGAAKGAKVTTPLAVMPLYSGW